LTIPAGVTGTFTFTLTVSDTSGTADSTVTIISYPDPTVTITGDTSLGCNNSSLTLTATSPDQISTYLWNTGSTAETTMVTQPGEYYVIVTDQHNCLDTSAPQNVTQQPIPVIQAFPDTTIKYGDSVLLYAQPSLDGPGIDSFRWYGQNGLSCDTCLFPFAIPLNTQYYGVNVYSLGCVVSDSVLIQVILPINFFIPNVFSPNGDGNNDYFFIVSQAGVTVESFEVYDRIGEKIHDGQYPWDGTFKGKPEPPGVYTYIFKLQLYGSSTSILRKGSVTLLR
jgi:gliding motility-associated-like protein